MTCLPSLLLFALPQPSTPPTVPALTEVAPIPQGEADADAPAEPKWTGSANLGATLTTGNTETIIVAASIDGELRREKDRHTAGAFWNYAEDSNANIITQRRAGANYQYDYFLSDKTYVFATAGALTDTLATLDLRWFAGFGAGRQFYEEENFKYAGEAGLVYFEEYFKNSANDTDYVAARLSHNLEKRLTETTVLEHKAEIFPSLEDTKDVYARLDTRLKFTINASLIAQLQWIYQWDNTPAVGLDRNDHQFIATLGWTF